MDYIEVSAKTIEEATSQATAQIESQGRVVTRTIKRFLRIW